MDAIFRHGEPLMSDYTPVAAVAAGAVIPGLAGGLTSMVTHRDLEAGVLGAVAVGGGVYEMVNADNSPDHTKVYWDNTAKKVTATATSNSLFGYITQGGGGGVNSKCYVEHRPEG